MLYPSVDLSATNQAMHLSVSIGVYKHIQTRRRITMTVKSTPTQKCVMDSCEVLGKVTSPLPLMTLDASCDTP